MQTKIGKSFLKKHKNFSEVSTDRPLACLGDAFVNFVYSLVLSKKLGKPCGKKLKGAPLAEAVRKAGFRGFLPSRIDKHVLSDAAEAVIVYAWLNEVLSLEECVEVLVRNQDLEDGLVELLLLVKERVKF